MSRADHRLFRLSDGDLHWLVASTVRRRSDYGHIVDLIRDKPDMIDVLLDDPGLADALFRDRDALMSLSPMLVFSVLVRRAHRDLQEAGFTLEPGRDGSVPVFDARKAAALLDDGAVRRYLAHMLASFTRVETVTVVVRGRRGWVRRAYSDMSAEDMAELGERVEPAHRLPFYRRAADVCLFLTGVFPDYVLKVRPSLEEYDALGQEFYRKAAELARELDGKAAHVLSVLADSFVLARKPLAVIAQRYLAGRNWFRPDVRPFRSETG